MEDGRNFVGRCHKFCPLQPVTFSFIQKLGIRLIVLKSRVCLPFPMSKDVIILGQKVYYRRPEARSLSGSAMTAPEVSARPKNTLTNNQVVPHSSQLTIFNQSVAPLSHQQSRRNLPSHPLCSHLLFFFVCEILSVFLKFLVVVEAEAKLRDAKKAGKASKTTACGRLKQSQRLVDLCPLLLLLCLWLLPYSFLG